MSQALATRFWNKVEITDLLNCWRWTACTNQNGYGRINVNRKMLLAHRVSYELYYGPIPKGKLVCHHCDVPSCVRPDHLFIGTQQDNMNDMLAKKRDTTVKGEKHGRSKITKNDVLAIRALYKNGIGYKELSQQFDTGYANVCSIVTRRSWKHL